MGLAQLEGSQKFAIDVGCRNETVIKLVGADCSARSIAHISINGTSVVSVPGKSALHLTLDAVSIVVSAIAFNNNRSLLTSDTDRQ